MSMALAYILPVAAVRLAADAALTGTHYGGRHLSPTGIALGVVIAVNLFRLILPLIVGFFGARLMLKAMRRTVPAHLGVPTSPIAWATLSAGVIIFCFELIFTAPLGRFDGAQWYAWPLVIAANALAAGLLWYAGMRCMSTRRSKAVAAPVKQTGSALSQKA
jgi:hypothetical protein